MGTSSPEALAVRAGIDLRTVRVVGAALRDRDLGRRKRMNHGRLPWLTPGELDDAQRSVYDQIVGGPRSGATRASALVDDLGRFQGPFNALLIEPVVGEAVQNLGSVIRYGTQFSSRAREIAILVTAGAARSNFEWHAHAHLGRAAGLSEVEIAAIRDGIEVTTFDPTEQMIWRVARSLVAQKDLDDELFAAAEPVLGLPMLVDLVVLVGYYELLARSLRVWRTPMPDGVEPPFGEA
jgi:alkylhydroperoxidase family enzyme